MITYEPNRNWLRDLRHLGASYTLIRIARGVLLVGLYAVACSALLIWLKFEGHRAISGTFSLLGVILSIVLVFRTNSAYDRWWEGRKLWGSLVNHSRNLAIQLDALLPADASEARSEFARLIADFALALSGHLRGAVDPSVLRSLAPEQDSGGNGEPARTPPSHVPTAISRVIVSRIHDLRREEVIDGFALLTLKPHTQALLEIAGACDRIRRTPIPFSYSVFIKFFILSYTAILPAGLVPEYGYFAVPLVMLIVFALLGLELMAEEIEEPFGTDCNDLPTDALAQTIRNDAATLLGVSHSSRPASPALYSKVF